MSMDMAPTDSFRMPRASYPLGRAWFVVFVSATEMHWSKDEKASEERNRDVGYFPVERAINELGFETYVPVETKREMVSGRRVVLVQPVFGRYVFVRFDREADDWGEIKREDQFSRGIKGVHRVLRDAFDAPIRVPDTVMSFIRWAETAGVLTPTRGLAPGATVEIEGGPFAGLIGKLKSASKHKRAKVLLKMLGTVDVETCFLKKIG